MVARRNGPVRRAPHPHGPPALRRWQPPPSLPPSPVHRALPPLPTLLVASIDRLGAVPAGVTLLWPSAAGRQSARPGRGGTARRRPHTYPRPAGVDARGRRGTLSVQAAARGDGRRRAALRRRHGGRPSSLPNKGEAGRRLRAALCRGVARHSDGRCGPYPLSPPLPCPSLPWHALPDAVDGCASRTAAAATGPPPAVPTAPAAVPPPRRPPAPPRP